MTKKAEKETVLKSFIAKAQQKLIKSKEHLTKELIVPSLSDEDEENEGKIKIRSLTMSEISECADIEDDPNDLNTSDVYAVYLAVMEPDLKSAAKEMMAEGVIDRALDIVHTFDQHEISDISREIMKLSGVLSDKRVKIVEDLKN